MAWYGADRAEGRFPDVLGVGGASAPGSSLSLSTVRLLKVERALFY